MGKFSPSKLIEFIRDGDLAVTVCKDPDALHHLEAFLTYDRKVYKHLTFARRRSGVTTKIEIQPRQCFQYVTDESGALERQFAFLAGFLPRLRRQLTEKGYETAVRRLHGCDQRKVCQAIDWDQLRGESFRWMQPETLELVAKRDYGRIKCPVGWGKGYLIDFICRGFPRANVVVTTQSLDVLETLYDYLRMKMPRVGMVSGRSKLVGDRVELYSLKSLHRRTVPCDLLLVDEVHEAGTDDNLIRVCAPPFKYAKKFGLSASVGDRSDDSDFELEGVFGQVLVDLKYEDCVAHKCVTPIEIHWRDVTSIIDPTAGVEDDVEKERHGVWKNGFRNRLIAQDARSFPDDEQVLITVKTIEHAMNLKRELPEFTLCYGENGLETTDRNAYIADGCIDEDEPVMSTFLRRKYKNEFERRELKKVIATSVWNRGVNFRSLAVLIRADASASTISDIQIPGRTSRVSDGKSASIVIDYRDQFSPLLRGRAARRERNYDNYGWEQIPPNKSAERIRAALQSV